MGNQTTFGGAPTPLLIWGLILPVSQTQCGWFLELVATFGSNNGSKGNPESPEPLNSGRNFAQETVMRCTAPVPTSLEFWWRCIFRPCRRMSQRVCHIFLEGAPFVVLKGIPKGQDQFRGGGGGETLLWMDEILHQIEIMGNYCWLVYHAGFLRW